MANTITNTKQVWEWPLWCGPKQLPDYPGTFGAIRKFDMHTGVDLYTYPGMPVLAVEDGIIIRQEAFTGPAAGSPWWNDTDALLIEGVSGVICYGEISPLKTMTVGKNIARGECIGCIMPVLKKDKGRPMAMLHLELYEHGYRDETVIWKLGNQQPKSLKDPTQYLIESLNVLNDVSEKLKY